MDPVAISVLASTTVEFLKPFVEKAGETAVRLIGEKLFRVLDERLNQKPAAKEALDDFKAEPKDEDLQAQLRVQIKKLLTEDPALAAEIAQITKEAEQTPAGATIINQVAGNNAIQFGENKGQVTIKVGK